MAKPCTFCGKSGGVGIIVTGPGVNICEACVDICNAVVERQRESEKMAEAFPPDPVEFLHAVANHLIGATGFTAKLGYENNIEISDSLHSLAAAITVETRVKATVAAHSAEVPSDA